MALDLSKTDANLGNEIHDVLVKAGVETPLFKGIDTVSNELKIEYVANLFKEIMQCLSLDLTDDSLAETPKRVAKMYINEIFWGLDYSNFPKITTIENKMQYDTMLIERNISVKSECEHHFLPFIGVAHVAYIPSTRIIGLSKINRIVEFFSRRPQVQERLTEQVYHALCYILGTESVAVCLKSEHTCVKLRGIEDAASDTITSRLGGAFIDSSALRNEFYHTITL